MLKSFVLSLLAAAVVTGAGAASAATVINVVGTKGSNSAHVFGKVSCSVSCKGILSDGSLSDTTAFGVKLSDSSESTEASSLSTRLSSAGLYTKDDASKEDNGVETFQFFGKYIALKTGNVTSFLFNSAGIEQTLTYTGFDAGGLSHKTNIGVLSTPPAVPLPAAGWMLLTAAGGLGFLRKRRKV